MAAALLAACLWFLAWFFIHILTVCPAPKTLMCEHVLETPHIASPCLLEITFLGLWVNRWSLAEFFIENLYTCFWWWFRMLFVYTERFEWEMCDWGATIMCSEEHGHISGKQNLIMIEKYLICICRHQDKPNRLLKADLYKIFIVFLNEKWNYYSMKSFYFT